MIQDLIGGQVPMGFGSVTQAKSMIEAGKLKDELPVAHEILPSIRNRLVLFVALFLHDIAKGRPEDHSIAGARTARRLCPRLGLNEAETDAAREVISAAVGDYREETG